MVELLAHPFLRTGEWHSHWRWCAVEDVLQCTTGRKVTPVEDHDEALSPASVRLRSSSLEVRQKKLIDFYD